MNNSDSGVLKMNFSAIGGVQSNVFAFGEAGENVSAIGISSTTGGVTKNVYVSATGGVRTN